LGDQPLEKAPHYGLDYEKQGYFVIRDFLSDDEIAQLKAVLIKFHHAWQQDNHEFYQARAINSAYLTDNTYLADEERMMLFKLIASEKLMNVVEQVLPSACAFMNTQLFFNPVNSSQQNYWHRDSQYHLSLKDQQAALFGPQVIHFRLPVFDEPGVEVISGSHQAWDNEQELAVRLEQDGHQHHEPLERGTSLPLSAGDLLVFSANMIHRGLYGGDRLSLDVIYCDDAIELLQFVKPACLPNAKQMSQLEKPQAFINTAKHCGE